MYIIKIHTSGVRKQGDDAISAALKVASRLASFFFINFF